MGNANVSPPEAGLVDEAEDDDDDGIGEPRTGTM
jgi:hypothetical protein